MTCSPAHRTNAVIVFALLAASLASLRVARAQEEQQPQTPQPSEQHRLLQKDVGTWDAEVTVFSPIDGAPPMISKAVEKCEMLPGGMWLISRFEGEMIGEKYVGLGTFGFDPVEKKYVGTWVDSMSPHLMIMKGDYDAATKTLTTTGEGRDSTTGEVFTSMQVSRYIDNDTRTFEMHMPAPEGKHVKVMEIKYKRRAG